MNIEVQEGNSVQIYGNSVQNMEDVNSRKSISNFKKEAKNYVK